MQLSNIPGKLVLPWATSGNKNNIPVDSQVGITAGAASLTDGFPPLTMTPVAAGGVPPSGLDMNGILYEMSNILRWANAGGGYAYDSTFANDSHVGGYPKGARVMRSDGMGYWFNTIDNNITDPEAAGADAAGWVPDYQAGAASVAMSSANVTLTPSQYGKSIIVITGTLTADLNLIFPEIVGKWSIINSTTGGYSINAKTTAGVGVKISGLDMIVCDGSNVFSITGVRGAVNVKDAPYSAKGDGLTNDTAAILAAMSASKSIYIPAGTYVVDHIDIPAGCRIRTDGVLTIIKRAATATAGIATLSVVGSNVEIDPFAAIGDIATSTGEWNHCLMVNTTATTGALDNIIIHGISGSNVRGDVLYLGANSGYPLTNVQVGQIEGANVLRNVCSICGGQDIEIVGVKGVNVGLYTLDIEPETYNTPVDGVIVHHIRGKAVGCVSAAPGAFAANIQFGIIQVNPDDWGSNSTPAYASGGVQSSGIIFRNTKNAEIGALYAQNYNSFAINVLTGAGELGLQELAIGHLQLTNCSLTDVTYNGYVNAQPIERLTIMSGAFDSSAQTGKRIFFYGPNVILNNIKGSFGTNCNLSAFGTKLKLNNAEITGTGGLVANLTKGVFDNVTFTGGYLASSCSPLILHNVVATCSNYVFNSSYDSHYITNSVLNGVNYDIQYANTAFRVDATNKRVSVGTSMSPNCHLSVGGSNSYSVGFNGEIYSSLRIVSGGSSSHGMRISIDANNYGQIQGYRETVGVMPIALQPLGGNVAVGVDANSATSPLDINGNRLRVRTAKTPANATDVGNAGEICWDANYVYVCVATNSWKRSPIAAW